MDCFFVSVERKLEPSLLGKPVIVGGTPGGRGVVAACSYETREKGVKSGMAISDAYRRCPNAVFLRGSHAQYKQESDAVKLILEQYCPVVQQASIDEFYLDFTGCERLYGNLISFTHWLQSHIHKTLRLPCTVGIGSHRHIAKVACNLAKPSGLIYVVHGEEPTFLSPFPLTFLQGMGKKTATMYHYRGVHTIGELASFSLNDIHQKFGKWGVGLYYKALGLGSLPSTQTHIAKSIGKERTFPEDISAVSELEFCLTQLVDAVSYLLRQDGFKAGCIQVKIRYSNFETIQTQATLPHTDNDMDILKVSKALLHRIYKRRLKLRLIGVRLSDFQPAQTLPLFPQDYRAEKLRHQVDKIKTKFGKTSIRRGNAFFL